MPNELQNFLAAATKKAADDLIAAIERLPEEKRNWKPLDKGRSALDQAAECAILNGATAQVIQNRAWQEGFDFQEFERAKEELAGDWNRLKALLEENAAKAVSAIQNVPDDALTTSVAMPWGNMTLAQIISYPFWNMSYHEGQTNYIASIA